MISDYRDLLKSKNPWFNPSNSTSVCLATTGRLARNLSGYLFVAEASFEDLFKIEEMLRNCIEKSSEFDLDGYIRLDALPNTVVNAIAERKFCSFPPETERAAMGLALSKNLCSIVQTNNTDHLRMTHTEKGLNTRGVWEYLDRLDSSFADMVEFAYDSEFGFLTYDVAEIGTGLRLSALLYLPALCISQQIDKVNSATSELGCMMLSYLESDVDDAPGHLYGIANKATTGITELEICTRISEIVSSIENFETRAMESLLSKEKEQILEDIFGRAFGLLKNAKMLSLKEALDGLSYLNLARRLGMKVDSNGTDFSQLFSEFYFDIQPNHIHMVLSRESSEEERAAYRATMIQNALQSVADAQ